MHPRFFLSAIVSVGLALAIQADAGISPYLRLAYGGGKLKMTEMNGAIEAEEASLNAAGYPASLLGVAPSRELHTSAGVWLLPVFRVGGTYSVQKSFRKNRYHPVGFFYEDQLTFFMEEIGGEAVIRVARLAGLSIGGELAHSRASFTESFGVQDAGGYFGLDGTAETTKTTWGGFVGLEQTTEKGLTGYARLGYRSREMGSMPGEYRTNDGYTTVQSQGSTLPMDFSGLYFRVGIGCDLVR